MLTIIDEYSRECLAIVTERSLKSDDVLDCLTEMFIRHGAPDITGSIIAGQQPADLSAEKLIRRIDLPLDWSKQRQLLGFI